MSTKAWAGALVSVICVMSLNSCTTDLGPISITIYNGISPQVIPAGARVVIVQPGITADPVPSGVTGKLIVGPRTFDMTSSNDGTFSLPVWGG